MHEKITTLLTKKKLLDFIIILTPILCYIVFSNIFNEKLNICTIKLKELIFYSFAMEPNYLVNLVIYILAMVFYYYLLSQEEKVKFYLIGIIMPIITILSPIILFIISKFNNAFNCINKSILVSGFSLLSSSAIGILLSYLMISIFKIKNKSIKETEVKSYTILLLAISWLFWNLYIKRASTLIIPMHLYGLVMGLLIGLVPFIYETINSIYKS